MISLHFALINSELWKDREETGRFDMQQRSPAETEQGMLWLRDMHSNHWLPVIHF